MSGDSRVRIRQLTSTDLDGVVQIAAELKDAPHWPLSVYADILELSSPKRIAVVAEDAGTRVVVGYAVASVIPPEGELESIAVSTAYQRQGVARRLFETLTRELGRSGVNELLLEVRASDDAARGFYKSLGFVEEGSRRGYYDEPVEDAILMRLKLGPALGTPDDQPASR
jgi:[ribosomal protein S18]-alanine N-acetyltransferase